jgi:signal transduction histidine kinase
VELERHADAMKSLVAAVAHELTEPLIVAESFAISLEEGVGQALDEDMQRRVAIVGTVCARARLLIETLLTDARTADRPAASQTVDAGEVLGEVLEMFGARLRARDIDVRVAELPTVRADRGLLTVVFQNLVSNALKYGPRELGRIEVGGAREPEAWRFHFTSGGSPLSADQAQRIFEPFYRVPGERRAAGAGLGLAICRQIVERHDGRIGVEPHAEDGNTFWFTLRADR